MWGTMWHLYYVGHYVAPVLCEALCGTCTMWGPPMWHLPTAEHQLNAVRALQPTNFVELVAGQTYCLVPTR